MRTQSVAQMRAALAERVGSAPAGAWSAASAAAPRQVSPDTAEFSAEAMRLAGLEPEPLLAGSRPSPPSAPTLDTYA